MGMLLRRHYAEVVEEIPAEETPEPSAAPEEVEETPKKRTRKKKTEE